MNYLRNLAVALLKDENGVGETAYEILHELLDEDVRRVVHATDGRFYLPEDWKDEHNPSDLTVTTAQFNFAANILKGQIEVDNDNQIIIYTGLQWRVDENDPDIQVEPYAPSDDDDE